MAQFSRKKKLTILVLTAALGFLNQFDNLVYLPLIHEIALDLNTILMKVAASISIHAFVSGSSPFIWSPSSDFFGRRKIILIELFFYSIASTLIIFSKNVLWLIFARALQGFFMGGTASVGITIIHDVFEPSEKGRAFSAFLFSILGGIISGPIAGGFIGEYFGWRANFYLLVLLGTILTILFAINVPETAPSKRTFTSKSYFSSWFHPFKLYKQYMISSALIPMGVSFGVLYFMMVSIPILAQDVFNYGPLQAGLTLISPGIGGLIATFFTGWVSDKIRNKKGSAAYRLIPLFFAYPLFIFGLILFSLFCYDHLILGLIVSSFIADFSYVFILNSTQSFVFEVDPSQGSSIATISGFSEFTFYSIFTQLVPIALDNNALKQWGFSLVGVLLVCILFSFSLFSTAKVEMPSTREHLLLSEEDDEDDIEN